MPSAGTRVRTVDNERLDKNDFDAIFSLVYGWAQLAHGMISGVAEGVLSPPTVTYEAGPPRVIRLGECTLYGAKNDGAATNSTTSYPIVYDPTDPNQLQTTVDLNAFSDASGVIWWTVDLVDADLDNRRVWEAGYPDGRAVAMLTRQEQRVRFEATPDFDTPPAVGTWYRMGAFYQPASGAPTVVWCYAGDYGFDKYIDGGSVAAGADLTRWIGQWVFQAGYTPADNEGRAFGAMRMISQLAMRVLSMIDSGYTFNPKTLELLTSGTLSFADDPVRGLKQLNADLAVVEADVTALEATVTTLDADVTLLNGARTMWVASVTAAGDLAIYNPFPPSSTAHGSTGVYDIAFDAGAPSGRIISSDNGIPFISLAQSATADSLTARWNWTSTYNLTIYIYRENGGVLTLTNQAFSVQIQGQYI